MEQELISIVVPVYRAERYIEETMDCVRAQTYPCLLYTSDAADE